MQALAARQPLLVKAHAPTLGNREAKVHIVEFLDPACGTCRAFYPFVKSIMANNRDRIRLSVRHVALHQGADMAVRALLAAQKQGRYWQTLEALLAAQPDWVVNHVVQPERVLASLNGAGLDMDQLQKDLDDPEIARAITQDAADARALNVTKTPEYFVNGRQMRTFGYDELRSLIGEELARAYD